MHFTYKHSWVHYMYKYVHIYILYSWCIGIYNYFLPIYLFSINHILRPFERINFKRSNSDSSHFLGSSFSWLSNDSNVSNYTVRYVNNIRTNYILHKGTGAGLTHDHLSNAQSHTIWFRWQRVFPTLSYI